MRKTLCTMAGAAILAGTSGLALAQTTTTYTYERTYPTTAYPAPAYAQPAYPAPAPYPYGYR